jgi:hypothetical protein
MLKTKTKTLSLYDHGSGNTWARLLLEYGAGSFTGSTYHDTSLMPVLPAEGVRSHEVRFDAYSSFPPFYPLSCDKLHFDIFFFICLPVFLFLFCLRNSHTTFVFKASLLPRLALFLSGDLRPFLCFLERSLPGRRTISHGSTLTDFGLAKWSSS